MNEILNIMVLALSAIFVLYRIQHDLHMFQQNSYKLDRYMTWLKSKDQPTIKNYDIILAVGMLLSTFYYLDHIGFSDRITGILSILGLCFIALAIKAYNLKITGHKVKKKLVYTPRVKRLLVTAIVLILAITLTSSILAGPFALMVLFVINVFSFALVLAANALMKPVERAINNYYINDAKKILAKNKNLIVVGITGSYGKTSTKNVLRDVLAKEYNVLMTPESYNTTLGVVRTIREQLKPTHEVFIVEMGAKQTGDIEEICKLVNPIYGIITSIGPQHLETFKTIDNVISTKGELFANLKPGGKAFVNMDDPYIKTLPKRDDIEYITYSVIDEKKGQTQFYPSDTRISSRGTTFDFNGKDLETVTLTTKLLGAHNIGNIISSLAVAVELGVTTKKLRTLIHDVEPVKHRLSYYTTAGQYVILDDAFNSNPIGSKNALQVLKAFDGNRKFIITPGMIELGDQAYELNKKFGEYMAEACDFVVLVGKKQTQPIQDGLKQAKYPNENLYIASDLNDGFAKINSMIQAGDVLLIENDLPDSFNE